MKEKRFPPGGKKTKDSSWMERKAKERETQSERDRKRVDTETETDRQSSVGLLSPEEFCSALQQDH